MSRVLRVDVQHLIGRPWQYAPNGEPGVEGFEGVRGFFTRYDDLLEHELPASFDLTSLRSTIARTHRTYQAAKYQDVIGQLAPMLSGVDRAARLEGAGHDQELAFGYVSAYVVAAKLLTKVGATDLAMLAADRAANKAMDAESTMARGMAAYQVACALLRADRSDDAEHLAVSMAEQIQRQARSDAPTLVSVSGALWLIAAVIAARRVDREEAWARLDRGRAGGPARR